MDIYYIVTYARKSGAMRQTKGIICESGDSIEVQAALGIPRDWISFCNDPWEVVEIEPVDVID